MDNPDYPSLFLAFSFLERQDAKEPNLADLRVELPTGEIFFSCFFLVFRGIRPLESRRYKEES